MMLVAIHQPQYLPWLGYFDKMDQADCFVLLDNVQYKKNEWQNRNRVKTAAGPAWLTVPVHYSFPARIDQVAIGGGPWRRKHAAALEACYGRTSHWSIAKSFWNEFYRSEWEALAVLNAAALEWLRQSLGIDTPLYWASELEPEQGPTRRLVDICRKLGADAYLSGVDGAKYMEMELFDAAGIEVVFQDFVHPDYPQQFGSFSSHLSALDLVFNCGSYSGDILRQGRRRPKDRS
jgi:hypothetical protein